MNEYRGFSLSPQARQDLFDIWDYMAENSIDAADCLREDLTDQPVRFWNVQSYPIIYRLDTDPLEIVRIVSGYRDVSALLNS